MDMLNVLRPRHIVQRYDELYPATLRQQGIRGVMIDLDNTLVPWPSVEIDPAAKTWVQRLQSHGIPVCLVTNALHTSRARPIAEELGVPWVKRALKPLGHGFRRGLRILGTAPEETAMIGDQIFTDICGGNLQGLFTVLVQPLGAQDSVFTRVTRPVERWLLAGKQAGA